MSQDKNEHNAGYEKTDTNPLAIMITAVVSILLLIVTIVVLYDYFITTKEAIIFEQLLQPESKDLLLLRRNADSVLTSYELLDSTTGTYRIPIEQAMKLLATDATEKD